MLAPVAVGVGSSEEKMVPEEGGIRYFAQMACRSASLNPRTLAPSPTIMRESQRSARFATSSTREMQS